MNMREVLFRTCAFCMLTLEHAVMTGHKWQYTVPNIQMWL